jgi:hypothetical protein
MAVKAQVMAALVSRPRPGGPSVGSRAIVRCRVRYRIPPGPVAGIDWNTVRALAARAGRCQARTARHLVGVPGQYPCDMADPSAYELSAWRGIQRFKGRPLSRVTGNAAYTRPARLSPARPTLTCHVQ